MSLLITNIGELVTNDPAADNLLGVRTNAAIVVEDGLVSWIGDASAEPAADKVVDAGGRAVLPGFVDSHSHLVFAGDRALEFQARMAGESYAVGGIRTTVAATRAATDEELAAGVARHVEEMWRQGTTTVEIKSGYGLSVDDEARSLRIARGFTDETTFLGAHVVAPEYADDSDGYVELVTGPMLEAAAPHARWIDVFCEHGAFDEDQARTVLEAGAAVGLRGRLHANQMGEGPGVRLACELGLTAVDHCTYLTDDDVDALAHSGTIATLLPGVEFSTSQPWPDARRLLDAGVTVALATDCNPGSSYTSSMPFCIALAVRDMGMSPAEALWAATAGGAATLARDDIGILEPGRRADLVLLDAPSYVHLAYRPGLPLVNQTCIGGRKADSSTTDSAKPTPMTEPTTWHADHDELIRFAAVLVDAERLDYPRAVVHFFEKPWKWDKQHKRWDEADRPSPADHASWNAFVALLDIADTSHDLPPVRP